MNQRLNYVEAAAYLGLKVPTLRSMVCRKQVPHIRLSAQTIVFDTEELDKWMPTLDESLTRCFRKKGRDLYAVFCTVTRMCKIGCANDAVARLSGLQIGSPTKLILWCHAPFLGELESKLHRAFAESRAHGEWFGPDVTARIAESVRRGDIEAWVSFAESTAKNAPRVRRSSGIDRRIHFEWRGKWRPR